MSDKKLLCLREAKFHVGRFGKDFEFGEIVRERDLEKNRIEDFNKHFQKLLPDLVKLKEVTVGESKDIAQEMFKYLIQTRKEVIKLYKESEEKNPPLNEILKIIKSALALIVNEGDIDEETEKVFFEHLDIAIEKIEKNKLFIYADVKKELKRIYDSKTILPEKTKEEMDLLLDDAKEASSFVKIKNNKLGETVTALYEKLDANVYILEKEIDLKPEIEDSGLQKFPVDVIKEVASKIKATREVTVFEYEMGNGENLLAFRDSLNTTERVYAYGTDSDLETSREAKRNGVDFVAKKGIYKMSHKTFDIALCINDRFTFFGGKESVFSLEEETKFNFLFQRSVPKDNGLVIFNVPFYLLDLYQRRLGRDLTIEGMYRVDDEMQNILVVARYKKSASNEELTLRKAMLNYKKLPDLSELKEIIINKGELEHPKEFRPYFVDEEDIVQAFEGTESSLSLAKKKYKPVEKAIELNSPLVEYKEGHLPAVATIEIVNGIYDTNHIKELKGIIDSPTIYTTKIIQQDVTEEKEEMYRGEMVRVVSQKKKNIIVAKARTLDGEVVELLKTN